LPARQREVVDLRVNHELSHAEIAALLGITEEASRASYYQALRRLREGLGAHAREEDAR
jgi:DNA-directed RNA polymerase specialized sigma24 family protein